MAHDKHEDYKALLIDAMVMFEEIARNRNMPPSATTQAQYVAMGRAIRRVLTENGDINGTE